MRKKTKAFTLEHEQIAKLERLSEATGLNMSAIIRRLIDMADAQPIVRMDIGVTDSSCSSTD